MNVYGDLAFELSVFVRYVVSSWPRAEQARMGDWRRGTGWAMGVEVWEGMLLICSYVGCMCKKVVDVDQLG